jgi:hypothetical protein
MCKDWCVYQRLRVEILSLFCPDVISNSYSYNNLYQVAVIAENMLCEAVERC